MKRYTVLLLRPDYVANSFGEDTYLALVRAVTPTAAITSAQQEVARLDDLDGIQAADYYPLITMKGWHNDMTPEAYR
ncbi:MAG: hypothetical protein WCS52_04855 [bacterium]